MDQSAALAMTPLHRYPNADRMLSRMTAGQQALFTSAQIQAIEEALAPRTHVLDLRLSLPLLGKGSYFVFMGGPNRRVEERSSRLEAITLSQNPPAEMPAALSHAVAMHKTLQRYPTAYRVLRRVPNSLMTTFQPAQIQAIEAALAPRSHVIDIRVSIPFFGKGAYLVFVAGPNQRARYQDIQNRNSFVIPAVFASIMIGAGAIVGLLSLKNSDILAKPDPIFDRRPAFYQTVIPFKKTQRECMKSGRQWIADKCIDQTHDPTF